MVENLVHVKLSLGTTLTKRVGNVKSGSQSHKNQPLIVGGGGAPLVSVLNKNVALKTNLALWLDQLGLAHDWEERYEAIKKGRFIANLDGTQLRDNLSKVANGAKIAIERTSEKPVKSKKSPTKDIIVVVESDNGDHHQSQQQSQKQQTKTNTTVVTGQQDELDADSGESSDDDDNSDKEIDGDGGEEEDPRTSRLRKRDLKRQSKALTAGQSRKVTPKVTTNNAAPPSTAPGAKSRVSRISTQLKFTPKSTGKTPKSADAKQARPMTEREKQRLKELGLGEDFEQNEKTADYFKNADIDELVNEVTEFDTLAKMKSKLLEPINKRFGKDPCCILSSTPNYIRLMCKYSSCPFQTWYVFQSSGNDTYSKIRFFRKINNNHSYECHKKAIEKDSKVKVL